MRNKNIEEIDHNEAINMQLYDRGHFEVRSNGHYREAVLILEINLH